MRSWGRKASLLQGNLKEEFAMHEVTLNSLFALTNPTQYRNGRENIFPSDASLAWFIRKNKAVLAKTGAIVKPAGHILINQNKFDAAVLEIGLLCNQFSES